MVKLNRSVMPDGWTPELWVGRSFRILDVVYQLVSYDNDTDYYYTKTAGADRANGIISPEALVECSVIVWLDGEERGA